MDFFYYIPSIQICEVERKQISKRALTFETGTLYIKAYMSKRGEKSVNLEVQRRRVLSPITKGFLPDFDRKCNVSKSIKNKI